MTYGFCVESGSIKMDPGLDPPWFRTEYDPFASLEHVHENVDDQEVAIASSEDDTRFERDLQDTLAQWMWNDH